MPNPQILLPNPNQFLYNIYYIKGPLGVPKTSKYVINGPYI